MPASKSEIGSLVKPIAAVKVGRGAAPQEFLE